MFKCYVCDGDFEDNDKLDNVCPECRSELTERRERIKNLISEEHSPDCAVRQVWGDGKCECTKTNKV